VQFLEPLCEQLFAFFNSVEENLRQFAHFFLPCMLGVYFGSLHKKDRKSLRCVEILLLGAYNLQILDAEGKPTVNTYGIPSMSKPSIYHEPTMLPQLQLTEHMLNKLEHGDNKVVLGPYPAVDCLSASNRLQVAIVLLRMYNQAISTMPQSSRASLCKMCSRLVNQGSSHASRRTSFEGALAPAFLPRVFLSSQILLEMLQAIYFSMFNGLHSLGHQALNDIHRRAMQNMFTDVLLMTNAIKNSLDASQSGHPSEGPMGISVAISPTTSTTTVSKAIITNASFRTKKLPDDIPIPKEGDNQAAGNEGSLDVIKEEGAEEGGAMAGAKAMISNLPKLPGMSKLVKNITQRRDSIGDKLPDTKAMPSTQESPKQDGVMVPQFVDVAKREARHTPDPSPSDQPERKSTKSTSDKKERPTATSRANSGLKDEAPKDQRNKVEQRDAESRKPNKTGDKDSVDTRRSGKSSSERKEDMGLTRNGVEKRDSSSPLQDTIGSTELRNLATAENTTYSSNNVVLPLKNGDKQRSTQV
ncbi:unnamed protein product, partial [Ixodes hexagonus]